MFSDLKTILKISVYHLLVDDWTAFALVLAQIQLIFESAGIVLIKFQESK